MVTEMFHMRINLFEDIQAMAIYRESPALSFLAYTL